MKAHPFGLKGSLLVASLLASAALVSGCFSDGKTGPAGPTGATGATGGTGPTGPAGSGVLNIDKVVPESCATCHGGVGTNQHQADYNKYTDASNLVLTIQGVTSGPNAGDATKYDGTMTIHVTQNGADYNAGIESYLSNGSTRYRITGIDQQTFYTVRYDSTAASDKFVNSQSFSFGPGSFKGAGVYEVYVTAGSFDPKPVNGEAYGYVAQGVLDTEAMTLYDNVANAALPFGDVGTYVSAANVAGCEKCHGTPYMKHGYRAAAVAGLPDFASCKTCHYDTRTGGHQAWQQMVNDPSGWAAGVSATDARYGTSFAYKAKIMNDVHMSHAMEFPYPQSMSNCVTCHEGKLTQILDNSNFTGATCKSCHPITVDAVNPTKYQPTESPAGSGNWRKSTAGYATAPAFELLWSQANVTWHNINDDCTTCHGVLASAPSFNELHTGYDKQIYDAAGNKYADKYTVSIDSISVASNVADIVIAVNNQLPANEVTLQRLRVYVGYYGYGTKNFLTTSSCYYYFPAYTGNQSSPCTKVTRNDGKYEVTIDMSSVLTANPGAITKIEAASLVYLNAANNLPVAVNAPSRTFDLVANAYPSTPYFQGTTAVVDVANCNACHGALATTFHGPERGGNVVVCRLCHVPGRAAGFFDAQSRSIDSFLHAFHSFQPEAELDTTDAVYAAREELNKEFFFPMFTVKACESCHKAGTYNVPDQSESLPAMLSAYAAVGMPVSDTGPASKACGGCHRAMLIKEGELGDLASFNQHTAVGGYLVADIEPTTNQSIYQSVVAKVMGWFN